MRARSGKHRSVTIQAGARRAGDHSEEDVVGYYNTGDRMRSWGKNGAFWGGIWGVLFGSAFFVIPGIGPLVAAGPLVGAHGSRAEAERARDILTNAGLEAPAMHHLVAA